MFAEGSSEHKARPLCQPESARDLKINFLFCFDMASCSPGWPPTPYVAKDNLELLTFLLLLPKCSDYKHDHHAWFMQCWGTNPGLYPCNTVAPAIELHPPFFSSLLESRRVHSCSKISSNVYERMNEFMNGTGCCVRVQVFLFFKQCSTHDLSELEEALSL